MINDIKPILIITLFIGYALVKYFTKISGVQMPQRHSWMKIRAVVVAGLPC
jgi:hypothetical protein